MPLARSVAGAVALFTLLNLLGDSFRPGFDATIFLVDLRALPGLVAVPALVAASALLAWFAVAPPRSRWRRAATAVAAGLLAIACCVDSLRYARLLAAGTLHSGPSLPFSVLPAAGLALVAALAARRTRERSARPLPVQATVALACIGAVALAFPLGLMATFGRTDYRRPADCVVIFGARAYADGTASLSLEDRTRTGCRLVLAGLAPRILFTGGPGDGEYHETEVMRSIALEMGVPESAILLDRLGHSTAASARNAADLLVPLGAVRVLAVSHGYHLPRVQLALEREALVAYTVPAEETRRLAKLPYYVAREVAALGVYWARPLLG
jgi:uncharacterized SAM-binding protein YcdF (DUF218 family)